MKKKIKIAIIISIILVIILAGTVLCVYFFTDTFRSEKQLFLEYISKGAEEIQFLKDEDLENYKEKQKNTPYTNNGQIKMNFISSSGSLESKELSTAQNCNISLQGSRDFSNNYFYQNVKVNYSDTENLDIELFNNQDLYGAKISNILKKYLAIENNNLKEWMEQLGLDEETIAKIPDKIENIENEEEKILADEEINTLKEKYLNILTQNLTDEMFSKEESLENTVFKLTINEDQLKSIISNLLQEVKDDEMIMNIIKREAENLGESSDSETSGFEDEYKTGIQNLIDGLNETEFVDETQDKNIIVFNIYVEDKNVTKTELVSGTGKIGILKIDNGLELVFEDDGVQELDLKVEKINENDDLTYKINCIVNSEDFEEQELNLSLDVDFKGISTLENVQETCTFSSSIVPSFYEIDEDVQLEAIYTNTKQFTTEITQEKIGEEDVMLLNGKNKEKLQSIFEQAGNMLQKVNEKQMKKIEADTNPMMYYIPAVIPTSVMMICNLKDVAVYQGDWIISIPLILTGFSVYSTARGIISGADETDDFYKQTQKEEKDQLEEMSETEKQYRVQRFNEKFEKYEDKELTCDYLNSLMLLVVNSNQDTPSHYIEVESNIGIEDEEVFYVFSEEDGNAKASMQCDEDGYIDKIIIEGI